LRAAPGVGQPHTSGLAGEHLAPDELAERLDAPGEGRWAKGAALGGDAETGGARPR
jgi:hypothetical protein